METAAVSASEEIVWLGMRLVVPAGWEILRHSVRSQKGRLVLMDRRRQRLQLSWVRMPTAPALDRAMADYRSRDLEEKADRTFSPLPSVGRWRGFRRHDERAVLTRAGQYDARLERWVEMAVEWPEGLDAELEERILRGFGVEGEADGRRWRAFGLNVRTPPRWVLETADAKPADVTFTFREGRRAASIRRIGATEVWYEGNLEGFLRKEAAGMKVKVSAPKHNRHPACLGESRQTRSRLGEWLGLGRLQLDLVWLCPVAHAMFHVTTHARGAAVLPKQFVVRCCGRGGGER